MFLFGRRFAPPELRESLGFGRGGSCRSCGAGNASRTSRARIATTEAVDPTLSVHHALLARVERVAGCADVDLKLGLGGAGFELVATSTSHCDRLVFGVNAVFHRILAIAFAFSAASATRRG